jgi:PAS domain-containing protein
VGNGESGGQQPLELILARNLISSLSTPGFLLDLDAVLTFYNESAGSLMGLRFEETGKMTVPEWRELLGPFDEGGRQIPFDELPVAIALRESRPAHARLRIRFGPKRLRDIEVSAFPIVGTGGPEGVLGLFWQYREPEGEDG